MTKENLRECIHSGDTDGLVKYFKETLRWDKRKIFSELLKEFNEELSMLEYVVKYTTSIHTIIHLVEDVVKDQIKSIKKRDPSVLIGNYLTNNVILSAAERSDEEGEKITKYLNGTYSVEAANERYPRDLFDLDTRIIQNIEQILQQVISGYGLKGEIFKDAFTKIATSRESMPGVLVENNDLYKIVASFDPYFVIRESNMV